MSQVANSLRTAALAVALCALATCAVASDEHPTYEVEKKVVKEQWHCELLPVGGGKKLPCGCALVAPNAVLTAAHCVDSPDPSISRPWVHFPKAEEGHQQREAVQTYLHEKWDPATWSWDAAIIILDEPCKQPPVHLTSKDLEHEVHVEKKVVDLVTLKGDEVVPLHYVSHEGCADKYGGGFIQKSMLCAEPKAYAGCEASNGGLLLTLDSSEDTEYKVALAGLEGWKASCKVETKEPVVKPAKKHAPMEPPMKPHEPVKVHMPDHTKHEVKEKKHVPAVYTKVYELHDWIFETVQADAAARYEPLLPEDLPGVKVVVVEERKGKEVALPELLQPECHGDGCKCMAHIDCLAYGLLYTYCHEGLCLKCGGEGEPCCLEGPVCHRGAKCTDKGYCEMLLPGKLMATADAGASASSASSSSTTSTTASGPVSSSHSTAIAADGSEAVSQALGVGDSASTGAEASGEQAASSATVLRRRLAQEEGEARSCESNGSCECDTHDDCLESGRPYTFCNPMHGHCNACGETGSMCCPSGPACRTAGDACDSSGTCAAATAAPAEAPQTETMEPTVAEAPQAEAPQAATESPAVDEGEPESACDCAEDGVSGGVSTGRQGCHQHLILVGDGLFFCMVEGGPDCPLALESVLFPGAAWRPCTAPDGAEPVEGDIVSPEYLF